MLSRPKLEWKNSFFFPLGGFSLLPGTDTYCHTLSYFQLSFSSLRAAHILQQTNELGNHSRDVCHCLESYALPHTSINEHSCFQLARRNAYKLSYYAIPQYSLSSASKRGLIVRMQISGQYLRVKVELNASH